MRKIEEIIVHCSATKTSHDIGADEIRKWHVEGNGWSDIGYHFVIRRDGTVENGRDLEIMGAHCKGHNQDSIGICLVGGLDDALEAEFNFMPEQLAELRRIIVDLKKQYPESTLHAHNEFSNKACPCFDVKKWWKA